MILGKEEASDYEMNTSNRSCSPTYTCPSGLSDQDNKVNAPIDGQAISANISGQGGGGGGGVACLTFCFLLTHRPILGLPEYKLKIVNISEIYGQGVLKLW